MYTSYLSLLINYNLLNSDVSTAELYISKECRCRNIKYLHISNSFASKTFFATVSTGRFEVKCFFFFSFHNSHFK